MQISISNLSKFYFSEGKQINALDNVDLVIPANEIFTLLGPSGCGKTTLLRCIVGLEVPDAGEITIGDEVVWSKDKDIFVPPENRGLSMVFQTYAIWPHMNVFDNVAYPLQTRKESKENIQQKGAQTLQFVQLEGFENRPATKLSGGQQQRVALARALAPEPKVILFDEPLSNLDAKLREETRKELRSFLTRLKITAVYVTHDRLEALSLSDTVAVMRDGRVAEIGTPRDIYFNSQKQFVADFIGRANLISGQVSSNENEYTMVDSDIGLINCRKMADLSIGTGVTVCIRPEFIRVVTERPPGEPNTFQGTIDSLVFVGDSYECEIRVAETCLITQLEPTTVLKKGDMAYLSFDPQQATLLLA